MKQYTSQVNPLKKILKMLPDKWAPFSMCMYRDFTAQMVTGGWEVEDELDCYIMLAELEKLNIISIEWDSLRRPISIKRLMSLK